MRISDNIRFRVAQNNILDLRTRQAEVVRQATSGLRVNAPSDDPAAAGELTRIDSSLRKVETFRTNITQARSDTTLAEGALGEAFGVFAQARDLAIQGANGALNAEDRGQIAVTVRALRDQLVTIANVRGAKGYLFAGSQTNTPPFENDGSYTGDDYAQRVEVAPGVVNTVGIPGSRPFTAVGGVDPFQVLTDLADALEANDVPAVTASLDGIDQASNQLLTVRTESGILLNRLDTAEASLGQSEFALRTRRSELGDADPIRTLSELTLLNTALEQAISVARLTLSDTAQPF